MSLSGIKTDYYTKEHWKMVAKSICLQTTSQLQSQDPQLSKKRKVSRCAAEWSGRCVLGASKPFGPARPIAQSASPLFLTCMAGQMLSERLWSCRWIWTFSEAAGSSHRQSKCEEVSSIPSKYLHVVASFVRPSAWLQCLLQAFPYESSSVAQWTKASSSVRQPLPVSSRPSKNLRCASSTQWQQ